MESRRADESSTPVPTTEKDQPSERQPVVDTTLTQEQHDAMQDVLDAVYAHRQEDGHDPSELFHRKVNKRYLPDYYDVIKEPVALSTIKAKIAKKDYKSFKEFVRDFALISHNAQVYNRPDAGAYHDGLEIKRFFESELAKLVEHNVVMKEVTVLPYLGEIPQIEDPLPGTGDDAEGSDDDDDDDDDDEGEETDDSRGKPRKRGRPRKSDVARRELLAASKGDPNKLAELEARRKRGRPPRVDTPTESRIKNIIKAMRKVKNIEGQYIIHHFDRLPDKTAMPEYFNEIKNPMAMDVIKRKQKRKKYQSVDQFLTDADLMFENAKHYNEDDSQIYKDAVRLRSETQRLAAEELQRPDEMFVMEDGRIPVPDGVFHNGELWKVGDWIHLVNPNDMTKPVPGQVYRTWRDAHNNKFINACWYYRPEQTVHRFDRHFYENEVVKTGQYRDHNVDEILDRCFIMFITRYHKGRPRNLPGDKEVYVCESRYNDEKHTFNKIKTWASCLPDEVRDKDYEMELFPEVRKVKKIPSPIGYLLSDNQRETDDLPKLGWGLDNAPPKIGAVHRRPRQAKESPPPEPTPSPPPREPTPPPPPMQPRLVAPIPVQNSASHIPRPNQHAINAASRPNLLPQRQPLMPLQRSYQPQASPARAARPVPGMTPGYSAHTPQVAHITRQASQPSYSSPNRFQPVAAYSSGKYQAPQTNEVYTLNEAGNAAIPLDIRTQFQRDEFGRVLFFTSPPLEVVGTCMPSTLPGHSVKYLSAKLKRDVRLERKRRHSSDSDDDVQSSRKVAKLSSMQYNREIRLLQQQAFQIWQERLQQTTEAEFEAAYGECWKEYLNRALARYES